MGHVLARLFLDRGSFVRNKHMRLHIMCPCVTHEGIEQMEFDDARCGCCAIRAGHGARHLDRSPVSQRFRRHIQSNAILA
jgi:hypothetical protein